MLKGFVLVFQVSLPFLLAVLCLGIAHRSHSRRLQPNKPSEPRKTLREANRHVERSAKVDSQSEVSSKTLVLPRSHLMQSKTLPGKGRRLLAAIYIHQFSKGFSSVLRFSGSIRRVLGWLLEVDEKLLRLILGDQIPQDWERGDYIDVFEALNKVGPFAKIYLADQYYYFCDAQTISDFLAQDPTEQETYVTETHDCDDFSFRLMGQFHEKPYSALAFGIAWSQIHAFNLFIDKQKRVWIIEPQNDMVALWEDVEDQEAYKDLQLVIM